jgi:acyl CoA:acetate/3-ketoacid CoA transferase beta subunit
MVKEIDNTAVLKEIAKKLDRLIVLMKLSNRVALEDFKKKIQRDKVSAKILENADGSFTYSDLSKKVATDLGVAEITVKKKISDMKELGILSISRKGKEAYYENSGLLD